MNALALIAVLVLPAQQEKKEDGGYRYFSRTLTYNGLALDTLQRRLARFGVDLGVPLAGAVDVRLAVDVPWNGLTTLKAYRAEGTVSSARLVIDETTLSGVEAKLDYRDGVVTLRSLTVATDNTSDPKPIRLQGEATMQVVPVGKVNAQVALVDVAWSTLADVFGLPLRPTGTLAGTATLVAPLNALDNPATWDARAELATTDSRVAGLELRGLKAVAVLKDNVATLEQVRAAVGDSLIAGSGRFELDGRRPFSAVLQAPAFALEDLKGLLDSYLPAGTDAGLAGKVALDLKAEGVAAEGAGRIAGTVRSQSLAVAGIDVTDVALDLAVTPESIALTGLSLKTLAGAVSGDAVLTEQDIRLKLAWTDLDLDTLPEAYRRTGWPALDKLVAGSGGRTSGNIDFTGPPSWEARRQWTADLAVTAPTLRLAGESLTDVSVRARLADADLVLETLHAEYAAGKLDAGGRFGLNEPYPYRLTADGKAFDLELIAAFTDLVAPGLHPKGRVTLVADAAGTLAAPPERLTLDLSAPALTVAGLEASDVELAARRDGEEFLVEPLTAQFLGGGIAGKARLSPERLAGDLTLDRVQLDRLPDWPLWDEIFLPDPQTPRPTGAVAGAVSFDVRLTDAGGFDPAASTASFELTAPQVAVPRLTLADVRLSGKLADGVAVVESFDADTATGRVRGSGRAPLVGDALPTAKVSVRTVRIDAFAKLVDRFVPHAQPTGLVSAELTLGAGAAGGWSFAATADAPRLTLFDVAVTDLALDAGGDADTVSVRKFEAKLLDGGVAATATVRQRPGERPGVELAARLGGVKLSKLAAAWADQGWSPLPGRLAGAVTGDLRLTLPRADADALVAGSGAANLQVRDLRVGTLRPADVDLALSLADGAVAWPKLSVRTDAGALAADGSLQLVAPHALTLNAAARRIDLSDWMTDLLGARADLPLPAGTVSGKLSLTATGVDPFPLGRSDRRPGFPNGWRPDDLRYTATASSRRLLVAGLDVADATVRIEGDKDTVTFRRVRAELLGGRVRGSGTLSVDPSLTSRANRTATADVRLFVAGIDAKTLASRYRLSQWGVAGQVRGRVRLHWPRFERLDPRLATGAARLDVSDGRLLAVRVGDTSVEARLDRDRLQYTATADAFRGRIRLTETVPTETAPAGSTAAGEGSLTVRGFSIPAFVRAWTRRPVPAGTAGTIDASFRFRRGGLARLPVGDGSVEVNNARYGRLQISRRLRVELEADGDGVVLRDSRGDFAGGRVSGGFRLDPSGRGSDFQFRLREADLEKVLGLLIPTDRYWDGKITVEIVGTVRETVAARGLLTAGRGSIYEIPISDVRVPFDLRSDLSFTDGVLTSRSVRVAGARGRAQGNLELRFGRRPSLDSRFSFSRVSVDDLFRYGLGHQPVTGANMTGSLTLSGEGLDELADLKGELVAESDQIRALDLPVVRALAPFLNTGSSTLFDHVDLSAELDRDVIRIRQLDLIGRSLLAHVDGRIIDYDRLNLGVIAHTGNRPDPALRTAMPLLRRFVAVASPPAAVALRIADALSDRLIALEIGGTLRRPIVRVRPLPTLQNEALRFIIREQGVPGLPVPQ